MASDAGAAERSVEEGDEVLGGGVPEEGEEELRAHIKRAWDSQEEPPNRTTQLAAQRQEVLSCRR